MIKKHISIVLVTLFFVAFAAEAYSQRTSTRRSSRDSRSSKTEQQASFADKLNFEISIGNIGFSQGFDISFKPHVAYNISDRASAGVAFRGFYSFLNFDQRFTPQEDISVFSFGPSAFGRYKISPEFFLQAEYTYMIYDDLLLSPNSDFGNKVGSPLLGGGYMSGYGPWKFGFQFLVATDGKFQDIENIIDYWFSFSYNF